MRLRLHIEAAGYEIDVDFWPEIGYYNVTDSDGKVFSERE